MLNENFKFKILNPNHSEMIQKLLLFTGASWKSGEKDVKYKEESFLFLKNNKISFGNDLRNFVEKSRGRQILLKDLQLLIISSTLKNKTIYFDEGVSAEELQRKLLKLGVVWKNSGRQLVGCNGAYFLSIDEGLRMTIAFNKNTPQPSGTEKLEAKRVHALFELVGVQVIKDWDEIVPVTEKTQAKNWRTVCDLLRTLDPDWTQGDGSSAEKACKAIRSAFENKNLIIQ